VGFDILPFAANRWQGKKGSDSGKVERWNI
jgi:hypothetical protein